jgi:hypothetical protein
MTTNAHLEAIKPLLDADHYTITDEEPDALMVWGGEDEFTTTEDIQELLGERFIVSCQPDNTVMIQFDEPNEHYLDVDCGVSREFIDRWPGYDQ